MDFSKNSRFFSGIITKSRRAATKLCRRAPGANNQDAWGRVTMALNRSPSTTSSKVPPCSSVKLRAMDSPSPEPSVVREVSPRTKRSISRSAGIFSASRDTFLTANVTLPLPRISST